LEEERYWIIEIADYTHRPERTIADYQVLDYRKEGNVAEIVFTNAKHAEEFADRICDAEHVEWRIQPVRSRRELSAHISSTVPERTHVLLDPVYGKEEESLHPIVWN
jgi:hypothetical protein